MITELVEKMNLEGHEARSSHVRKKRFQEGTDTREGEPVEVRKCDMGNDSFLPQFHLDIMVRNGGAKANLECLQLR